MDEEQLLERLMAEYGSSILRMCYLYLKDHQLAEDAAQETFIKAMNAYGSFGGQSSEKTWLTSIAMNCCKNIMRTQWFRAAQSRTGSAAEANAAYSIDVFVEQSSLSAAIMRLKPKQRQIILLHYYQGLSLKEIAGIMHTSENTAAQQLSRARQKLKEYYKEEDLDE